MLYRHADADLKRLEEDPDFNAGLAENLVKTFRKRMDVIRDAPNENVIRAFKSYRFEKLKGDRKHQHSIRLNDQFRLIVEIEKGDRGNVLVIIGIEDYH
jgi:proteic killer suppression protein